MADLARILSPCLWLLSLSLSLQQWQDSSCNTSGELPAAEIFLGTSSANEGDTVSGRCLIPSGTSVTIVFFCKDGMEISRLQAKRGKFSYDLAYRVAGSSGNISCGYMFKNDNNQVFNSLLSVPRYLKVRGANTRSSPTEKPPQQEMEKKTILAIIVPVLMGLILAFVLPLVYYLKKKKVVTKRRRERLQSLRERNNKATEDQYSDKNLNGYCCGMSKEALQPIYQNFDPEDVLCSTLHYQQELDSVFPLYVNDPRRP